MRGRGGFRVDDVLQYMRDVVWPKLDQNRGGHPYTEAELEADVRDAFTRYNDGPSWEYRQTPAVPDETAVDPFDGAGEGLNDAMLCAEVAKNVMAGRYRWARGLGWLAWTGIHWTPAPDQAVAEETRRYLLAQWRRAVQRLERAKTDEERKAGEQVVGSCGGPSARAASPRSPHSPKASPPSSPTRPTWTRTRTSSTSATVWSSYAPDCSPITTPACC
jgi:hypothetical protein